MLRVVLAILTLAALIATARAQSTIDLRRVVCLEPDADMTLATIAVLTGPEAEALADVVIAAPGTASITIADLRAALDTHARVPWGLIALRGNRCQLLAPRSIDTPPTPSDAEPSVPADDSPRPDVRTAVRVRLAELIGVAPADIRLSARERDEAVLNSSTIGKRLEIEPQGLGEQMSVRVRAYLGDRLVLNQSVRVNVLVRRTVPIAVRDLRRDETIAQEDVSIEARFIAPDLAPADTDGVVGSATSAQVRAGDLLTQRTIQQPVVVNKGDLVTVHCLSGGVVLKTNARALASARDGEIVQFQAEGSDRVFAARMNGPGMAVVDASTTDSKDPS